MMGMFAGTALAVVVVAFAVRRRQQRTLAREAAVLTEAVDGAVWVPDGPSDLPGFDRRWVRVLPPMRVEGRVVRWGVRRHQRCQPDAQGVAEVLDETINGFVALHRAEQTEGRLWSSQLPPESDARPAARLVRALWAELSVHQVDRLEARLARSPETEAQAAFLAAGHLVAGIQALVLDEDALVAWLASPPQYAETSGGPDAARHVQAWRAEQLLTWFDTHPVALEVAEREQATPYLKLRLLAALARGDAKRLLGFRLDLQVPEALRLKALARGLEFTLTQGDFAAVRNLIADGVTVQRWPERVVPQVMAASGTEAHGCVLQLGRVLAEHPQFGPQLVTRALEVDAPAWFLQDMLLHGSERVRAQVLDWVVVRRGGLKAAEMCVTALNTHQNTVQKGTDAACWLLRTVGTHGTAEHLSVLQPWTQARTRADEPDLLLRTTASDAVRAITERLPAGLVGGLSVADGEAGALSPVGTRGEDT